MKCRGLIKAQCKETVNNTDNRLLNSPKIIKNYDEKSFKSFNPLKTNESNKYKNSTCIYKFRTENFMIASQSNGPDNLPLVYDKFPSDDYMSSKRIKIERHKDGCDHFIVNSMKILSAEQICTVVKKVLPKEAFRVRRIRKKQHRYTRLSVNNNINPLDLALIRYLLGRKHGIELKQQFLKRNLNLESMQARVATNVHVLSLNINGIRNKLEELHYLLSKKKPDIICIQETKRTIHEKKIFLKGYNSYESQSDSIGLGMLIAVKTSSMLTMEILESDQDFILATVKGQGIHCKILNIYRSHDAVRRKKTMEKVFNTVNTAGDKEILLVGDWNGTPDMMIKSLSNKGANIFGAGTPTRGTRISRRRRISRKPIDFALANNPALVAKQTVLRRWRLSDHFPVLIELNHQILWKRPEKKVIFDKTRWKNKKIQEGIKSFNYDLTNDNTQEAFTDFYENILRQLREQKVFRTINKDPRVAFLSERVKNLIRVKRLTDNRVSKGLASLEDLEKARKALKEEIRKARRKTYLRHISKGVKFLKENDSRNAWKWIKGHSGMAKKGGATNCVYSDTMGTTETDPKNVIKVWTEHFKRLSEHTIALTKNEKNLAYINKYSDITDKEISWDEIKAVLKSLRNNKATGEDGIPCEVYKIVACEDAPDSNLSRCILKLLNEVYKGNCFPREWINSLIVPIYKKGDRLDPNNYRGISLINTLLKVLTKILATRLQFICNTLGLLRREQSGFLSGEECIAQAACLVESCQRRKIRGLNTYVCFLDLKKAYDMVPHERLINKLTNAGLGKRFTNFVKGMYDNTFLRVRINNTIGESFQYKRGVRQGCPTSPLLFNIYYDDVLENIEPIHIEGLRNGLAGLMFADDTVIFAETRHDLHAKIQVIDRWMTENNMELNSSKCGVLAMTNEPESNPTPITWRGETIPEVEDYVYLGIEITKGLSLEKMSRQRVIKGIVTLTMMRKTLSNITIPLEYKRMLIKNILIPRMTFGSEIFGMSIQRSEAMKRTLDNALKCIVKKSNFCRLRTYEELDITPIYVLAAAARTRAMVKWKYDRGFIKDLIDTSDDFTSKKRTWIKEANRWLRSNKISYEEGSHNAIISVIEKKMETLRNRDRSIIGSLARLYGLKSNKLIRKAEIERNLPHRGVNALMRLRTGTFTFSPNLAIVGKIPGEFRNKCVSCKQQVTEDIWHFLMECSAYNDMRKQFHMNRKWGLFDRLNLPQSIILGTLLGGEQVASRDTKLRPHLELEVIKFLARSMPLRQKFISDASGPAISQA
jgi:exonuclease III